MSCNHLDDCSRCSGTVDYLEEYDLMISAADYIRELEKIIDRLDEQRNVQENEMSDESRERMGELRDLVSTLE